MIKKQLKFFSTLVIGFTLLSGCSSKSSLSVFGEDSLYEKGLEHTVVNDIVNSFETKAIVNATYLNATNSDKWDDEFHNFLVGIYIVNDNEEVENQFLNNKKYQLTLNDNNISKNEVLLSTNILWEHIPIKNPHAKYYITSFQKNDDKTLNLVYKHTILGKVTLSFVVE
ncbi:MAG: hypothetical protein KAJ49_09420 [Arcobacteraceae bacterium]|nr:hypothetical protein [Arcobacteraceae bacterium]